LNSSIKLNTAAISTGMIIAKNPQLAEIAIGAGTSFFQGFIAGLIDTNIPKYDGLYSPGNSAINFGFSEAGNYLGEQVRSNYVE